MIAFYPGSFDPPTNGHIDVIRRASMLFRKLVIGVGVHHEKTPLLDDGERVRLLEGEIAAIGQGSGNEIAVVTFDGLVVDAARQSGASVIVRGLRNGTDFDYEVQMAGMNRAMAGDVDTIFLAASPEVSFLSSSLIRQIARMGGDIRPFVPAAAADALARRGG